MSWLRPLLFRLGERLHGWNILERLRQLEAMERWPRERLDAFRLERLQALLAHVYRNVPFYKDLWDSAGVDYRDVRTLEDIGLLPKTTKQLLMDAGDAALDAAVPKARLVEARSSGSTGRRFVYYKSKAHQSWWMAQIFLGWRWAGWELGDRWVRLQFRGPLSLRKRIEDWLFHCHYMPIDQYDEPFLAAAADRIARFRPRLLRGYAGGTYVFAKFLLEHGDERIRPHAVCCTGDTLYPHYREAVEAAFGCRVFDSYGGEGILATNQCEAGSHHLMPTVVAELEPEGPPAEDGQPCRLVLTCLTNTAMPLIRYDIADMAIAGDAACSCGRTWPVLKRILGRDTDIVVTAAGRSLVCHHFNNVFRDFDGVDQFQIRQERRDELAVSLETNDAFDKACHEPALRSALEALAGEGTRVRFDYVDALPVPSTGKRRYIISTVRDEADS